ncbi:MAG: sigma 54-interacting transcriptional regulator [Candidatus Binatales bacterium]
MRESESSPRGVRGRVLIADDTLGAARFAARVLGQAGYECEACANGVETLAAVEQRGADVVLADLARLGPELLSQLHSRYPGVALIALTFNPGVGSAIAAMRQGAFDYLVKPLDEDELCAMVARAIEINRLRNENAQLRRRLEMAEAASSFVAESPSGKHLLALVRRVAATDSIVLIEGESGTGKELLARMLHYWSERSEGPFVVVSCKGSRAAMAEPERNGSSGSASAAQSIPLKRALGGTLFLDEIAEAGPALQAELVRILDQAEAASIRSGSAPDVRIVAASSRSLKGEAEAGRFRTDLLYRLGAMPIRIPPLRERREDMVALSRRFLAAYSAKIGRRLSLTSDAERELLAYRWPGNVRELRNVIERAAMLTGADFVASKSLELAPRAEPDRAERVAAEPIPVETSRAGAIANHVDRAASAAQPALSASPNPSEPAPATMPAPASLSEPTNASEPASASEPVGASEPAAELQPQSVGAAANGTLQECLDEAARARIKAALDAASGNRGQAAKSLDVDGTTLGRLIKRLGL